jgi:hypothetical protein
LRQVLRVSASEVTLFSILRRYCVVKGKWVQLPPCGELQGSVKETTLDGSQVISIVLEVRLGGR